MTENSYEDVLEYTLRKRGAMATMVEGFETSMHIQEEIGSKDTSASAGRFRNKQDRIEIEKQAALTQVSMKKILEDWTNQEVGNRVRGVTAPDGAGASSQTKPPGGTPLIQDSIVLSNNSAGFVGESFINRNDTRDDIR